MDLVPEIHRSQPAPADSVILKQFPLPGEMVTLHDRIELWIGN
jgi:hypothetical protein